MKHGTATARRSGCKCDPCVAYSTRIKKLWRHRTGAPRGDVVGYGTTMPVEVVQAHVKRLTNSGWTMSQIARETGRSQQSLWNVLNRTNRPDGRKRIVRRDSVAAILALEPLTPVAVDDVMVERLLSGAADWTAATFEERVEAGRIALTRADGHRFCADVLHLNGRIIARLRSEVAA